MPLTSLWRVILLEQFKFIRRAQILFVILQGNSMVLVLGYDSTALTCYWYVVAVKGQSTRAATVTRTKEEIERQKVPSVRCSSAENAVKIREIVYSHFTTLRSTTSRRRKISTRFQRYCSRARYHSASKRECSSSNRRR